jgi:methylated-DNA-[protein]-cysteine S-methyltransferase
MTPEFPTSYCVRPTPFGEVAVVWSADAGEPKIVRIFLPQARVRAARLVSAVFPECARYSCAAIDALADEIQAAMEGVVVRFVLDGVRLDLCPVFQRKVLRALHAVPRGRVTTYGALARQVGADGAARAVGTAHATNPFPIVIPCHRTIRADRTLGEFGGGTALKRALLALEGVVLEESGKVAPGCIV